MTISYVDSTITEGVLVAVGANAQISVDLPACGVGDIIVIGISPDSPWVDETAQFKFSLGVNTMLWRVCDGTEPGSLIVTYYDDASQADTPYIAAAVRYSGATANTQVSDIVTTDPSHTNNRVLNLLNDWAVDFDGDLDDFSSATPSLVTLVYRAGAVGLESSTPPDAPTGMDASTSNVAVRVDAMGTLSYSSSFPEFPDATDQLFRYLAMGDLLNEDTTTPPTPATTAELSGPGGDVFFGATIEGITDGRAVAIFDVETPACSFTDWWFAWDSEDENNMFANAFDVFENQPTPLTDQFNTSFLSEGGSNAGYTKEAGEPDHAGNAGGHSAWWTWTPDDDGDWLLDLESGSGFPLLGVYTGTSVSGLTPVTPSATSSGEFFYHFEGSFTGGVKYYLAVDGTDGDQFNYYIFNVAI